MGQLGQNIIQFETRKIILRRFSVLRSCLRSFWKNIIACWIGKSLQYRQLPHTTILPAHPPYLAAAESGFAPVDATSSCSDKDDDSSDLVDLKISLLGDCQIGKSSFVTKYVGKPKRGEKNQATGLNQKKKTMCVRGARIAFSIWEVGGDESCYNQIPVACQDSVAMIFMFDLTSRCTLNSVIRWYQEARKNNQAAISVLVGTKFDDFIQLPIDLQWTIANQARTYARAMNATLFFSSSTYNINVNKIFKFIAAKLFNLPWNLERNLTIGEPIIDF